MIPLGQPYNTSRMLSWSYFKLHFSQKKLFTWGLFPSVMKSVSVISIIHSLCFPNWVYEVYLVIHIPFINNKRAEEISKLSHKITDIHSPQSQGWVNILANEKLCTYNQRDVPRLWGEQPFAVGANGMVSIYVLKLTRFFLSLIKWVYHLKESVTYNQSHDCALLITWKTNLIHSFWFSSGAVLHLWYLHLNRVLCSISWVISERRWDVYTRRHPV